MTWSDVIPTVFYEEMCRRKTRVEWGSRHYPSRSVYSFPTKQNSGDQREKRRNIHCPYKKSRRNTRFRGGVGFLSSPQHPVNVKSHLNGNTETVPTTRIGKVRLSSYSQRPDRTEEGTLLT